MRRRSRFQKARARSVAIAPAAHWAAILLVFLATGCSYQDFERPVVRNYVGELFRKAERPPAEPLVAKVESVQELAQALARWQEMGGAKSDPYAVGQGDVLRMSVSTADSPQDAVAADLEVDRSGRVRCAMVGEVEVAGLSVPQVAEKLTRLYREGYYRDPLVAVAVAEYRSKRIFVSGAVAKPGVVSLQSNRLTLLEALLLAGGPTEKAGDCAVVTRLARGGAPKPPTLQTLKVVLSRLTERGGATENVWIEPGDVISVPEASGDYIYVLGYVRSPGAYPLPPGQTIGILDAIASARGLEASANPQKAYLLRNVAGKGQKYRIDLTRLASASEPDVALQSGDRIVVQTSFVRRALDGILYSTGLRAFVPAY